MEKLHKGNKIPRGCNEISALPKKFGGFFEIKIRSANYNLRAVHGEMEKKILLKIRHKNQEFYFI